MHSVEYLVGRDSNATFTLSLFSSFCAELNGSSVANAGKETVQKPENVTTVSAPVESGEKKSDSKAADNIVRKQPAICSVAKDKQPNTQTVTSQSSQRTSMPGDSFLCL